MKLKELVPPLELCKKIPAGAFEDSAFCWHYTDMAGFICRTSGCEQVQGKEWQIVHSHPRKLEIRRRNGEEIYPAPTLQEILAELYKPIRGSNLMMMYCPVLEQWEIGYTPQLVAMRDENPVTVALKLWLKQKGIAEDE